MLSVRHSPQANGETGLVNDLRTVKAHRDDDEYKDMSFAEQQKVLGALVCVVQSAFKHQ